MGMYDRKSTTGEQASKEAKPLSYRERKKANSFSKNKELRKIQKSKPFHNKPKAELGNNSERPRRDGEWKPASDSKRSFDKPHSEKREFSGPSRSWKKSSDKPFWDKKSNDFKSPMSQSPSKPKSSKGPRKEYGPKKEFTPRDGQAPKRDFNGPKKEFAPRDGQAPKRDFNEPKREYATRPEGQRDFRGPRQDGPKRNFNGPRKEYGPKREYTPRGDSNGGNFSPKRDFSAPKTDRREEFVKTEKKKVDKSKYFKYGNNK